MIVLYDERLKKWRIGVRQRIDDDIKLWLTRETYDNKKDASLNAQVLLTLAENGLSQRE